jgi:hypothetical protein
VTTFRASSHSKGGCCVEVMHGATSIVVRDSKHTQGPHATHLHVRKPAWASFLAAVRSGDLDPQ